MAFIGRLLKGSLQTSSGTQNVTIPVGTDGFVLTADSAQAVGVKWAAAAAGTVTSVSGTTNRITVSPSSPNPTVDIAATYVGQTSITTLGTVATGTWNATNIALNKGGTNASLTASNGGIFYSTSTAGAILSGTATANQVLLSGSSTTPAWSTATYPATSGTSGNVLTSNGTNWVSSAATGGTYSPNSSIQISDDFFSAINETASGGIVVYGQLCWGSTTAAGGPGWLPKAATTSTNPGLLGNVSTGTASSQLFLGQTVTGAKRACFVLGGGAITMNWVIQTAILSNVTNRYTLRFGFGDTFNADEANGVYWEYSDNLNSGNWVGKTAAASTRSSANSAVAADTNFHNFSITINAAATSCAFFIDGVQIANSPLTSNIPTLVVTPFVDLVRSAGTIAPSSVILDLFYMTQTLTTPR